MNEGVSESYCENHKRATFSFMLNNSMVYDPGEVRIEIETTGHASCKPFAGSMPPPPG